MSRKTIHNTLQALVPTVMEQCIPPPMKYQFKEQLNMQLFKNNNQVCSYNNQWACTNNNIWLKGRSQLPCLCKSKDTTMVCCSNSLMRNLGAFLLQLLICFTAMGLVKVYRDKVGTIWLILLLQRNHWELDKEHMA